MSELLDHLPFIRRYVWHLIRDPAHLEDCVQDACVWVLLAFQKHSPTDWPNREQLAMYACRSMAWTYQRRRRRHQKHLGSVWEWNGDVEEEFTTTVPGEFNLPQTQVEIREAIGRLPPEEQMLVFARLWQGYSEQRVTQLWGMGRNTVRQQWQRVLTILGRSMDECTP